MGAIASLLATLGGLAFSGYASIQSTEQSRLALNAQITERFARSVEQLGSDSEAVRIGAVYSFARLMPESPSDQQAIRDVLSSFIRVAAARVPTTGELRSADVDLLAAIKVLNEFAASAVSNSSASMTLTDIDLSNLEPLFVKMRSAELSGANFTGTQMPNADLTGSTLQAGNFARAYLVNISLSGSDLTSANFAGATAIGADLRDADMKGTLMKDTWLGSANLTRVDLSGADLRGADLNGANLSQANLSGANLADANLSGTLVGGVTCSPATIWPDDLLETPSCD